MWQGMDVVACIKWLGPLVFHAAAKDAAIYTRASTSGACWTPRSTGVPADAPRARCPPATASGATPGHENPAWRFVAVGVGHDVALLDGVPAAPCAEVDPDMAVNIEHEDADYGRLEGLALAAENLLAAAAKIVKRLPGRRSSGSDSPWPRTISGQPTGGRDLSRSDPPSQTSYRAGRAPVQALDRPRLPGLDRGRDTF